MVCQSIPFRPTGVFYPKVGKDRLLDHRRAHFKQTRSFFGLFFPCKRAGKPGFVAAYLAGMQHYIG
jgi:hypothetical protein